MVESPTDVQLSQVKEMPPWLREFRVPVNAPGEHLQGIGFDQGALAAETGRMP